jgi:hypothetical protein
MQNFLTLLAALLLVGCIHRTTKAGDGPITILPPVTHGGEDKTETIALVNPGGKVPIYAISSYEDFCKAVGHDPKDPQRIQGMFFYVPPRIYVYGEWRLECEIILHEYQHYIEQCVPEKRKELREAFLGIVSDQFRIGYKDLEGPPPEDPPASAK